jgi:ribonuclease E
MAGLVVIDFIDMEQSSHVRKVEKAMKEALKNDRARIQVGRISSFGLMEMSRQRLRTGVLEASTKACPHCEGTGLMRTAASAGLSALRMIEDEAARGRGDKIQLRAGREAAVYLLNKKRAELGEIEQRYGVSIEVLIDESLEGARMSVESSGPRPVAPQRLETFIAPVEDDDEDEIEEEEEIEAALVGVDEEAEEVSGRAPRDRNRDRDRERECSDEGEGEGPRRRRRRRRGGRGRGRRDGQPAANEDRIDGEEQVISEPYAEPRSEPYGNEAAAEDEAPKPQAKRRRGRKPATATGTNVEADGSAQGAVEPDSSPMVERPIADEPPIAETETESVGPKARRRPRARKAAAAVATTPELDPEPEPGPAPTKPVRKRRTKAATTEPARQRSEPAPAHEPASTSKSVPMPDNDSAMADAEATDSSDKPRNGWWQRTFG